MKRTWWILTIFVLMLATAVTAAETGEVRLAGDVLGLGAATYTAPLDFFYEPAKAELPQMTGWPKTVPGNTLYGESCGLVMADIDGDDELEIIMATAAQKLWAWDYDGTQLFSVNLSGMVQTVPAVGDVNGDGFPEIVVATRGTSSQVQIFSRNGVLLGQKTLPNNGESSNAPTLANLDGDDELEIIVGERGSGTGWVYALNGDLTTVGGSWPATLDHVPATSAAVGDIDNDGAPEIAICSYYSLYAFEADGSTMSGFPVTFTDETYSYGSPALADLNGDGKLEILTVTHYAANRVHAIQWNGTELSGWPYDMGDAWSYAPPSVGDIDMDGTLEVVVGCSGGPVADDNLFVINHDGTSFPNFPYNMVGGAEGFFTLVDLTGDEKLEILFTNNISDKGNGYVFGIDAAGNMLDGFPLRPVGWTYLNGATVGDVNGDGVPEFGVVGSQDGSNSINLYTAADFAYGASGVHWRTYQSDDAHSGLYVAPPTGDDDDTTPDDDADDDDDDDADDDDDDNDDDDDDDGCGC